MFDFSLPFSLDFDLNTLILVIAITSTKRYLSNMKGMYSDSMLMRIC